MGIKRNIKEFYEQYDSELDLLNERKIPRKTYATKTDLRGYTKSEQNYNK